MKFLVTLELQLVMFSLLFYRSDLLYLSMISGHTNPPA